jgi:Fur family ferric uptake transcriptional regulator
MTIAPDVKRLEFADLADAVRALRQRGLRLSTARRLVLEALFEARAPIAAQELARSLSLEESSVYRNLELLERYGMVRHVHLGHGPGLYVLAGQHDVEYLYCESCAKVTAVSPRRLDPVRRQIEREFGHSVRFTHFAIVGLCEQCAAKRGQDS